MTYEGRITYKIQQNVFVGKKQEQRRNSFPVNIIQTDMNKNETI